MDKLEFKIDKKVISGREISAVSIFINGKNLIELIKNHELPFATKEGHPEIAGGYSGMYTEDFLHWYFSDWPGDDQHVILECAGCGEVGCWPLLVSVTENKNSIIWSNFEQPHRGKDSKASFWDYSAFPTYTFSKKNYQSEIRRLEKLNKSEKNNIS
ncbi:MAG: hypothetical protein HYV38_00795 [Candidatus Levybacteria bacterium]|nr:hypothetical protein [Candidatus Levybacteria bacterium]MBI2420607.1 hypothetical protein [Candidatus Levybacteria bacterium]